ncbi:SMI1/KNR4 family protein [Streptomyces sp. NPDC054837]
MTGREASRRVIELVRAHEDRASCGRGCSPETIARAEREMGLTFPPSYRLLIEEFGTWDVTPTQFLGVYQTEAAGDVLLGSVTETLDAGPRHLPARRGRRVSRLRMEPGRRRRRPHGEDRGQLRAARARGV